MNKATQIAAAARHMTASRYIGQSIGSIPTAPRLTVSRHEWDHLARRAKTFGATCWSIRGTDGAGNARMIVAADDGSECVVTRGTA